MWKITAHTINRLYHIHGFAQSCSISTALVMEFMQSCTKPSTHQDTFFTLWGLRPKSSRTARYWYPGPCIARYGIRHVGSLCSRKEREREIKFIGLFGDRGHWGPYSPYKHCNHRMCYLLKKIFLVTSSTGQESPIDIDRRHVNTQRKCDVIYWYLHIELIWCLLMVQYLLSNVIMKWTTRFISFTGWIPLKHGQPQLHLLSLTVKNLRCQALYLTLRSQNLQYKTHREFWPSHRQIFKTSLYHKTRLILEIDGMIDMLISGIEIMYI